MERASAVETFQIKLLFKKKKKDLKKEKNKKKQPKKPSKQTKTLMAALCD